MFQPHHIDVERHLEMRFRRVFPVSWEAGLKQSYQEALKKYQEQVELEKELWALQTEASVLSQRVNIFDIMKKNFGTLEEALERGDYEAARQLVSSIRAEIEERLSEEEPLLQRKLQEAKSKGISVPTYTVPSYTKVKVDPQPKQPAKQPAMMVIIGSVTGKPYYYYPDTRELVTPWGSGYCLVPGYDPVAAVREEEARFARKPIFGQPTINPFA
ncbi:MAG: hypothetical protein NZ942_02010, partial [Candidatus Aenigmarchaeota archaeon]|nr:hypothetical protein [Candidatus Aenigmarchaeota archaeon]